MFAVIPLLWYNHIMNKAYKYRIYPTTEQTELFLKTFGCCRFVKNFYLTMEKDFYKTNGGYLSKITNNNHCNRVLKEQYSWLREVDKFALTNAIYQLDAAFQGFFHNKSRYPKYRSRKSRQSYTTNFSHNNIAVIEGFVKLPKLGKVKAKIHRVAPADWKIKSATISMERDSSFYVSVLYEYEEIPSGYVVDTDNSIGLDYKSDGLYTDSNGDVANMPHYYRKSANKLAKSQRKLKNKVIGSNNYRKQQRKVAKIHRHVANQRKDYLHKLSTEIANQYDVVCVENLDMKAMSNKGFGNGKATLDNGYGMFLEFLDYKLSDRGKYLVKVDKWFPSSQLCSECGAVHKLALNQRTYKCACGNVTDRDYNAAKNIKTEGLRLLTA